MRQLNRKQVLKKNRIMKKAGNIAERNTGFSIKGVDLFCGAGGLTRGLEKAGVDVDPACEYPFNANNRATFLLKTVEDLSSSDFAGAFDGTEFTLLAGCAPCQPFSTYSQGWSSLADERWNLLERFGHLVKEMQPDLVTMENVPRLEKQDVFLDFVSILSDEGFFGVGRRDEKTSA